MKPKQSRGQQRYEDIVAAAERLIEVHGYDKLTIRSISEECGATTGSIYNVFSGKEDILKAIVQKHYANFRDMRERTQQLPASVWRACSPNEFINLIFDEIITYLQSDTHILATLRIVRPRGMSVFRTRVSDYTAVRYGIATPNEPGEMLYAMFSGLLHYALDNDFVDMQVIATHLRTMLTSYLAELDVRYNWKPIDAIVG